MSATRVRWSRRAVVLALLVAAGACVAAMNWFSTWTSFARLDVDSGGGAVSLSTVEAQANLQRWVLVALMSLVVAAAALASEWLARPDARTVDRRVVPGGLEVPPR